MVSLSLVIAVWEAAHTSSTCVREHIGQLVTQDFPFLPRFPSLVPVWTGGLE